MAITYVGAGTGVNSNGAVSPGVPAGIAANDLLLLFAETRDQALGTSPSGFTQHPSSPVTSGNSRLHLWYKIAAGTETTISIGDSGNRNNAIIIALRGVDTSSPFDVAATNTGAGGTSPNGASITTTIANAWVLAFMTMDSAAASFSAGDWANAAITSETERVDFAGSGATIGAYSGLRTAAGSTGGFSATLSTAVDWTLLTLALKPSTSTAYSLAINAGSYSQTGTAITLKAQRKLALAAGAHALTGAAIALGKRTNLAIVPGAYSRTGTAITLRASLSVNVAPGAHALGGNAIGLGKNIRIAIDTGAYAPIFDAVGFVAHRKLGFAAGYYAVTGGAIVLGHGQSFAIDAGVYASAYAIVGFSRTHGPRETPEARILTARAGGRRAMVAHQARRVRPSAIARIVHLSGRGE